MEESGWRTRQTALRTKLIDVLAAFDEEDEGSVSETVAVLAKAILEAVNLLGIVGQETDDSLGLLRAMGESYQDLDPPG